VNKDKLRSIISKKAKGDSTLSGQLYQMFFFERILERLSKSQYKHNIILKGGLLLSSIIGDDERTTKDMDATLKSMTLEKENIHSIFTEILSINLEDDVSFEIIDIKDIREEDEYGGFKVNIMATMDNLKIHLAVEITTGDKITPREIEYNYNSIFENKKIPILAYTTETIIAEKYHTVVERGLLNTRMKDFYDLYILVSKNKEIINTDNLKIAIENTFAHRKTEIDVIEIQEVINDISKDKQMRNLWSNYQKNAIYAKDVKFEELFDSLKYITSIL
jgi:predicted nucleotidyltransferase component of viral defense system